MIHDAGCTCDDTDLPHHVSTHEELVQLLQLTKIFLQNLRICPVIVTMARSSLDEFCPDNQVDFLQNQVLDLLESMIGHERLDVKIGYETAMDS